MISIDSLAKVWANPFPSNADIDSNSSHSPKAKSSMSKVTNDVKSLYRIYPNAESIVEEEPEMLNDESIQKISNAKDGEKAPLFLPNPTELAPTATASGKRGHKSSSGLGLLLGKDEMGHHGGSIHSGNQTQRSKDTRAKSASIRKTQITSRFMNRQSES